MRALPCSSSSSFEMASIMKLIPETVSPLSPLEDTHDIATFCYKASHGYFLQVTRGQGQTFQEARLFRFCSYNISKKVDLSWKILYQVMVLHFLGIALTTEPHQLLHQNFF